MHPKFIEKAREELREDESRKSQALQQMREWIAKHPFLSGIRQDDAYLLQFLRVRKFNVDEAFNTLERAYMAPKRYLNFFEVNEELTKKVKSLFDAGFCYPLIDRDAEGRKIIFVQPARCDINVHTTADGFRLLFHVVSVLLEEEETQIAGIVFIFDHLNVTMKHVTKLSPVEIRDFMDAVKNMTPARQKASFVMDMPPIATFIIDLFLAAMNEKLRSRFKILKNADELKDHVDQALLPTKYGGIRPKRK